jgi:hypothetical protein
MIAPSNPENPAASVFPVNIPSNNKPGMSAVAPTTMIPSELAPTQRHADVTSKAAEESAQRIRLVELIDHFLVERR